jgi:flavodoxin
MNATTQHKGGTMMKKVFAILLAFALTISLSAWGGAVSANLMPASGDKEEQTRMLVTYFSCTGNTKRLAEYAADILGADIYEIKPKESYSTADLNYNDPKSRTSIEQNDAAARPEIDGSVANISGYDVIFIGYPIWWGEAPKIIYAFLESYDFSGKTIVPFCTSGGSGMGFSAENLQKSRSGEARWIEGRRWGGSASKTDIAEWLGGLGLEPL